MVRVTGRFFNEDVATVAFDDIAATATQVAVIDKTSIGESLITIYNDTDQEVVMTLLGGDGVNMFDIGPNGTVATVTVASGAKSFALVADPWWNVQVLLNYSVEPISGSVLIRHCNGAGPLDV